MKHYPVNIRDELKETLLLAGPIVLNQVGHMTMGMVDTFVAGKIGTTALAGLGLAANYFWTFSNICIGFLLALDTWFSQAAGAKDEEGLTRYLSQSMWSCILMTLVTALIVLGGMFMYEAFSSPGEIRNAFVGYIYVVSWSIPTLFLYFVLQRYWQAQHDVIPFTMIVLMANVLNYFGNLALGLGMWGFPKLGVQGLALSTVFCRYAMLTLAVLYTWWRLRPQSWKLVPLSWPIQARLFRLGWPAAGHVALEMGAFALATFMVATLGAVPMAAHHICLMMASFTFMFPLGFSSAAAVRVGRFIGAGQPDHARTAGWICIILSVGTMSIFAVAFLLFPRWIMGWYTQDPAVINLGAAIFLVVAIFQISDGIQVSTTGALRGAGNTRAAMIANLIGHYPVGLALGGILCFGLKLGVVGMWWGLAAGLITVAAIVVARWHLLSRDTSQLRRI